MTTWYRIILDKSKLVFEKGNIKGYLVKAELFHHSGDPSELNPIVDRVAKTVTLHKSQKDFLEQVSKGDYKVGPTTYKAKLGEDLAAASTLLDIPPLADGIHISLGKKKIDNPLDALHPHSVHSSHSGQSTEKQLAQVFTKGIFYFADVLTTYVPWLGVESSQTSLDLGSANVSVEAKNYAKTGAKQALAQAEKASWSQQVQKQNLKVKRNLEGDSEVTFSQKVVVVISAEDPNQVDLGSLKLPEGYDRAEIHYPQDELTKEFLLTAGEVSEQN